MSKECETKRTPVAIIDDDGFQKPKKKHQTKGVHLGKPLNYNASHQIKDKKGVSVNKGTSRMIYRPVQNQKEKVTRSKDDIIEDVNPYSVLDKMEDKIKWKEKAKVLG